MEPHGFLHNQTDVKILILFILSRIDTPLSGQEIYEVAYQDESLNYFTLAESLPQLEATGHIAQNGSGRYTITEKGRKNGASLEDALAVPVVQKVLSAIEHKQMLLRREGYITTAVSQDENGYWIVTLRYRDDKLPMMTLSLMAPSEQLGQAMAKNLKKQADSLYKMNFDAATDHKSKGGTPHEKL